MKARVYLTAFFAFCALTFFAVPAAASHHSFNVTNNASQRINAITMIYPCRRKYDPACVRRFDPLACYQKYRDTRQRFIRLGLR